MPCHAGWTHLGKFALKHQLSFAMSAPTYSAGSTPSGEATPFLVASPTGIALILLTFVIRVYIRFNFSGPWLVDDTVFTLAMVRNLWAELLGIELVIR
jgi:hypothetical protein